MSLLRSVRSRVILGSILGAIGLFAVSHVIAIAMVGRYSHIIRVTHGSLVSIVAILCILAGLYGVRSGLSPLTRLRERLSDVRGGRVRRVEGEYPTEVQPLVDDLNALLEHREAIVSRALAKAGDLAHGLKTPLAILVQEAGRAEAEGHCELAAAILHQVERMRRQVDYQLAQARAVASGSAPGARSSVAESAERICRTLQRLHAARELTFDVNVPAEHAFLGQSEDLEEMLGNLLDNACKWAKSRVAIQSVEIDGIVLITIDDDGTGLDASMRDVVLQRGVRADEAGSGSGLGLSIVRDLAELYGGSISLDASPLGGLQAQLRLPACKDDRG